MSLFSSFGKSAPSARADSGLSQADVAYLEKTRALPILNETAERDLAERWIKDRDRKAHDALVTAHLRLVPAIAQKYQGYGIPLADLVSEGNFGLIHSVDKFDPTKGFRFSTYARWWIKAAILNHIVQSWSLVKVGSGANKKRLFFNLRRAKRELQPDGQRFLSTEQINSLARSFRVSAEDIIAMDQRLGATDVSLAQPVGAAPDGDGMQMGDTLADETPNAEERLIESDERAWQTSVMREAMDNLDRREKEILSRRYLTKRPVTLASLAALYGLTAERVRQIEAKAITKLRQYVVNRSPTPGFAAA
jgi:RNA polymerase sigma-32 factor